MGVDPISIAFIALNAFKAVSAINTAKDQAKTIAKNATAAAQANVDSANLASKEKAKQIRFAAARQTTSFLSSGLTLEGTPSSVIGDTYTTGIEDLDQISKNSRTQVGNIVSQGNAQSKEVIAKGRSEAINDIASSFSNFGGGNSLFNTAGSYLPDSAIYGLNNAGYGVDAYSMMDLKDRRS